ncbi:MAG: TolC family protein [Bacteriovoracaceae bacterium]
MKQRYILNFILTALLYSGMTNAQDTLSEPSPSGVQININNSSQSSTPVENAFEKQRDAEQLAEDSYIQRHAESREMPDYKILTLGDVIEQGLRENHDQRIRNFEMQLLDLGWKDTYSAFWFPKVDLTLSTDSYRIGELYDRDGETSRTAKSPNGNASLSLGEYTVFNWGKDYLAYLSNRATYTRSKISLKENRRELKQNLIIAFFDLMKQKKIEMVYREQLKNASFVYRFNRERLKTSKTTRLQFLQARNEYLRAQTEYQEYKILSENLDENVAKLISDPVGTRYLLKEELEFRPIKMKESEAIGFSQKTNPEILNSLTSIENAKRSYEIQKRENLPLPKFTVDLGAYTHSFSRSSNSTRYENDSDTNVEIVATLNATWSLFGEGGFFNQRKTAQALVSKNKEVQTLIKSRREASANIRQIFRKLKRLELRREALLPRVSNAEKLFETAFKDYTDSKTLYINFSDSLKELRNAKMDLYQAEFEHLQNKILLAQEIGVEELPGEIFEKLAILPETKSEEF